MPRKCQALLVGVGILLTSYQYLLSTGVTTTVLTHLYFVLCTTIYGVMILFTFTNISAMAVATTIQTLDDPFL